MSVARRWRERVGFWFCYWLPSSLLGLVTSWAARKNFSSPPRRIAVLLPERIGDVILTLPLLDALRERFPEARIVTAVTPLPADLLETSPSVDEVIRWPAGFRAALRVGATLRRARPDLVVVPRADPDQGWAPLVSALSAAPRRVTLTDAEPGWPRSRRLQGQPFFTDAVRPATDVFHESARRLSLAAHLGAKGMKSSEAKTVLTLDDERAVNRWLDALPPGMRIAFGIGSAAAQRRWPPRRFAELIDVLAGKLDFVPVLIASSAETPVVDEIRRHVKTSVQTCAGLSLRETVGVLRGCALFVGNDSGAAHLAACAGVPVVVISAHPVGGSPRFVNAPEKTEPLASVRRTVRPPVSGGVECAEGCVHADAHCVLGVTVAAVADAARSAWNSTVGAGRPGV